MPVTVYTSEDTDAPKLFDQVAGTTTNFWKKILVDGYGTKPSAGWSMPFIDGHIAVFQNAAADCYFRLDGADAGKYFFMSAYLSMSDAHTGLDGGASATTYSGRGYRCTLGTNAHDANRDYKWMVVADEYTAYLFVYGWNHTSQRTENYYRCTVNVFGSIKTPFGFMPFLKLSYETTSTSYAVLDGSMIGDIYYQGVWMNSIRMLSALSNTGSLGFSSVADNPIAKAGVGLTDNSAGAVLLVGVECYVDYGAYDVQRGLVLRGVYEPLWNAQKFYDSGALLDPNERIHYFSDGGRPFVRILMQGYGGSSYSRGLVMALDDWGTP